MTQIKPERCPRCNVAWRTYSGWSESMETFAWDDNFTTGLERVDEQHHRLVELINRLGDSLIAGTAKDDAALQVVFGQLADYAQYHFAEEERLMLESGVSPAHRELHQRHHTEFVQQLSTMWNSRRAMADPADNLHGFLRAWLAFHILGEDQSMAREIAQRRSEGTPADAAHKDHSTAALLSALHNLYHVLSAQNRDLAAVNVHLEARVAERTRELALANETLTGLNRRLETLSNTDGLLGIANRRHFNESLAREWRGARRERQPLSLLMIDVDYFKRYNDAHGHQAGDVCLQSVAQAALSAMRRPADLLARYGGEELIVMLPDTGAQGAMEVAQAIRRNLAQRRIPHGDSPVAGQVTVSIGAATTTPDAQTRPEQLIAAADRGLYAAKEGGRDSICTA